MAEEVIKCPNCGRRNRVPAFGAPGRPARLRSLRGTHGIERVGLACPAPVLAVGTTDLNNPDTRGGDVPGRASAVAAGSLDAQGLPGPSTGFLSTSM